MTTSDRHEVPPEPGRWTITGTVTTDGVGELTGWVGVLVGVGVGAAEVGVGVAVGPPGVQVAVGVAVGPSGVEVGVLVGVFVGVLVGVLVGPLGVFVGVLVAPAAGYAYWAQVVSVELIALQHQACILALLSLTWSNPRP